MASNKHVVKKKEMAKRQASLLVGDRRGTSNYTDRGWN